MEETQAEVVGVDIAKGRWVAVALRRGRFHRAVLAPTMQAVLAAFPEAEVFAVDVPVGYPDPGEARRPCDRLARAALPGRAASRLFPVPPREVLAAPTHAAANRLARALTGQGISAQSYGLRRAIFEAEDAAREAPGKIFEVHPELSFAAMVTCPEGGRLAPGARWAGTEASKKTWDGMRARQAALADQGIVLPGELGEAGRAPVDDVLDAAAAAWSAARIGRGLAGWFGAGEGSGLAARIWY